MVRAGSKLVTSVTAKSSYSHLYKTKLNLAHASAIITDPLEQPTERFTNHKHKKWK
jgi:hypothetical protein